MFEGKLTIDVSDRFIALIAGLTGAIEGIKGPALFNNNIPHVTPAEAGTPVAPVSPTPVWSVTHTQVNAPTTAPAAAPTATPVAPAPVAPVVARTAAPMAPAPTYTLQQIGAAGAALIQSNPAKRDELTALLQQYGVQSVAALKPEQLGAFATALRGLGANI